MKTLLMTLAMAAGSTAWLQATPTIDPAHARSYGANIGWMNWLGDATDGVVIGGSFCSGKIWAANVGWIDLGDGTPANGTTYGNDSARDYGINLDGSGNLSGYAYGANIGWIQFGRQTTTGASYPGPTVDRSTGRLQGYVWSANAGWIMLDTPFTELVTLTAFVSDSDEDGIEDDWERRWFGDLGTADAESDFDSDGRRDVEEFVAATDPTDATDYLRINLFVVRDQGREVMIGWTSQPDRIYRILGAESVAPGSVWNDVGLGEIPSGIGTSTQRSFTEPGSGKRFYRVEAIQLAP